MKDESNDPSEIFDKNTIQISAIINTLEISTKLSWTPSGGGKKRDVSLMEGNAQSSVRKLVCRKSKAERPVGRPWQ